MAKLTDTLHKGSDWDNLLGNLHKRIFNVEQILTSPVVMGPPELTDITVETITVDDGAGGGIVLDMTSVEPTGLTLDWSSYYDEIYIDIEWDPPASYENTSGFQVDVSKQISPGVWDFATTVTTAGTQTRFRNAEPNTTYRVQVYNINALGIRSTPMEDTIATGQDNSIPPVVTGVTIARGATSAIVTFTPLTEAEAPDVANGHGLYLIELSTAADFSVTTRSTRTSAQVVQFGDLTAATTYYARVAAIDSSGNQGPWANSTAYTAGGVIENMMVGTFTGALITVGTLNGDRIVANTASVNVLTTSSLTSAAITLAGGSLKAGNPPTDGLLINSQGLRLYNAGALTVTLDAAGTASFSGTISASTISGGSISATTITGSTFQWNAGFINSASGIQFLAAPTADLASLGYLGRGISWYRTTWGTAWNITGFADNTAGSTGALYIQSNLTNYDSVYIQNAIKPDHRLEYIELGADNVDVAGTFSATSKLFKIPHPLKDRCFLQHANLEGPEQAVYYRGRATVGHNGQVRVQLPSYFAVLTRVESRMAILTPIGDGKGAWSRLEAGEVGDDGFTAYGREGQEFFWLVMAVRADVPRLVVDLPDERTPEEIDKAATDGAYDEHVARSYEEEVQNIIEGRTPANG